jgi:hypothetical protein
MCCPRYYRKDEGMCFRVRKQYLKEMTFDEKGFAFVWKVYAGVKTEKGTPFLQGLYYNLYYPVHPGWIKSTRTSTEIGKDERDKVTCTRVSVYRGIHVYLDEQSAQGECRFNLSLCRQYPRVFTPVVVKVRVHKRDFVVCKFKERGENNCAVFMKVFLHKQEYVKALQGV